VKLVVPFMTAHERDQMFYHWDHEWDQMLY